MCGRYALEKVAGDLIEQLDFAVLDQTGPHLSAISNLPSRSSLPDYNIAPTKQIPIIRQGVSGEYELTNVSWGIVAPWSKNEDEARKSQSRAINARRESIHEKPTFRDSFRSKRCLIPADGYYEWATEIGQFPSKQPFYIHRADGRSLFFAGIWASWSLPASQNSPQLKIESAAVITREAVSPLAQIHHRMPLLLTPDRYLSWLNRSQAVRLEIMEQSEPAAGLSAYPVSTAVNKATASGPGLRHPIDLGELARARDQLLF